MKKGVNNKSEYILTPFFMNNLLLPGEFSKEIFNFSQKFTNLLAKAHKKNFREIIRGMILSKSGFDF